MQIHTSYSRMLLRGLVLIVALSSSFMFLRAEGVKQLAPTPPDGVTPPVMLLVNDDIYGNFAAPDTDENNRLYVTIDQPGEVINLGLSILHDQFGRARSDGSYSFQIRAEDGTIVSEPTVINESTANVVNFDDAEFGVYDPDFTFTPAETGNYYIEFLNVQGNIQLDDEKIHIGYWDITVSQAGTAVLGRVWSRNWAYRTPPIIDSLDTDECIWNRPFEGALYSYTGDDTNMEGFVSRIDFAGSGFKGLSFNVAFNSRGPGNSGDLDIDRQSIANPSQEVLNSLPEYRVFLNEPDPTVFISSPGCAAISFQDNVLRCDADGICFPVIVEGPGQIEVIIDLDLNEELTPDSRDRVLLFNFEEPASLCLPWDGLDALGDPVPAGTEFNVIFLYAQGVQHFSGFDVEKLENGFCVETIRPGPESQNCFDDDVSNSLLYYDDQQLPDNILSNTNPDLAQSQDGRQGCECGTGNCRTWNNFTINDLNSCDFINDDGGIGGLNGATLSGYGDRNLLNTWWYAYTQKIVRNVTLLGCSVGGQDTICAGTDTEWFVAVVGGEAPYTYDWTGPDNFSSTDSTVTVSVTGEYCATVTDDAGCTTTCCLDLFFFDDISCEVEGPDMICPGETATYAATITGGVGPFTYSWTGPGDLSANTESIEITEAGEYCATVTDANGCITECCQTLSLFEDISCEVEGPTGICEGETATYTATITGGVGPFTYSWTGPEGFSATTDSIEVSEAGEYCATVTDANGCTTECCQTLNVADDLSCVIDGPTTICEGDTATYTVIITDGEAPFTYSWTGPDGFTSMEESVMVTTGGEYCVIVTDANGCDTECCITLEIAAAISCEVTGPSMICAGDNADYGVIVTGGNGPFTYSWSGPGDFTAMDENIVVSEEGEYCVMVTDANGCTTECCQTLSFFAEISCEVEGPTTICPGDTATYTATISGGTGPFTYNWTGPSAFSSMDESIMVTEAGEYCVLITDANGCSTECCQTLSVSSDISCEVVGPTTICADETATYTVEVTGGTAPFDYEWTGPGDFMSMEESITVSEAGEYCVLITDAGGCTTECCITLTVSADLSCEVTGPATICMGDTTTYGVEVIGGTAPFTYNWTGPGGFMSTEESNEVFVAGEYCVTVTDANGCETECCQTLSFFDEISCMVEGPTNICAGDSATYTVDITNGLAPFTFSWTGPGDFMSTDESITVFEAGEYCVLVTDANGCMTECCQTLSISPEISCEVEGPTMICEGDEATYTAVVTGGEGPFTINWTGPGDFSGSGESVTVSAEGEYCAMITDANGCATECCQILSFFPDISCTIDGPDQICADETATYSALVMGGAEPFSFSWTGPDNFSSTEQSITISTAGEYCATVTDANGCSTQCCKTLEVISINVNLTATETDITLGASTTLMANANGCNNCVFEWAGPNGPIDETGSTITVTPVPPLPDNGEYVYTVTVSEDGLCPTTASITIRVTTACTPEAVFLPNAFTPNGDDLNDVLQVETLSPELYQEGMLLMIYDRWGEEVFRTTDIFASWDGTFRGERLPPDAYGFYLRVICPGGEELVQSGNVTILR
ncbi:MAG: gliding motility-associated C-terminal domain-containing protein [Bacteroidota bacterium]